MVNTVNVPQQSVNSFQHQEGAPRILGNDGKNNKSDGAILGGTTPWNDTASSEQRGRSCLLFLCETSFYYNSLAHTNNSTTNNQQQ
jgi:hypothetical protein